MATDNSRTDIKKKIALLHDGGPISGISNHIYKIYANLRANGYSVDLYQYLQWIPRGDIPKETIFVNKPRAEKYKNNTLRSFNTAVNLLLGFNWKKFKKINSDITILSNPSLLKLNKYVKNCCVLGHDLYYLHENNDSKVLNIYFKRMYNLFDQAKIILSDSEFTKNELISILQINPDKIVTVYPYVDNSIFYPGPKNFREKLNLNPEDKLLLSIGSDQPNKNIVTIIQLMKKLPMNYKLIRIGKSDSTLKLIHELNLNNRIFIMENLSENELSDIYRACDMLIFPSLFEGFGIPIIESMACGTPVLTSNRGSLPEVVADNGIISDPYDIDFMHESILRILEDDHNVELYRNKSILRSQFFTADNQLHQLTKVFEKLV